jgi:hypothetical protein
MDFAPMRLTQKIPLTSIGFEKGVNYVNGHSVFPTVTRVNATVIGTGFYPSTNGIVSNSMYVPEVNPTQSFSTGEYKDLLKLNEASGGQIVLRKRWAKSFKKTDSIWLWLSLALREVPCCLILVLSQTAWVAL